MPYVSIPILNPIHITEVKETDSEYSTVFHDKSQTTCYYQPVRLIEGIFFELITDFSLVQIRSFYCDTDERITTVLVDTPVSIINGLFVYRIQITDEYFNYGENKIYLLITLGLANDPNKIELESNSLEGFIKDEGNLVFEYTAKDNTKGIIFYPPEFDLMNPKPKPYVFKMRVAGCVYAPSTKLNSKNFIDQFQNYTKLSGFPYNSYKLCVGGSFRIPEWLAEKLNHVFTLKSVRIDGKYFTAEEGSSLTAKAQNPQSKKYFYEADIIESESKVSNNIVKGASINNRSMILDFDAQNFGNLSNNNNSSITITQIT